jgi:uridine phosphorylase
MPKRSRKDSSSRKTYKRKRVEIGGELPPTKVITDQGEEIEVPEIVEEMKGEEQIGENKLVSKKILKKKVKEVPREQDIRAQFPVFDNKMMHLLTQKGDIANRVLICSEEKTAWRMARFFDNPAEVIKVVSTRHFVTYTGLFEGVPISVIASGMGGPMIDFTMREAKFCIDGPMAAVRYGLSCSLSNLGEGDVVVCTKGSFNVQSDFCVPKNKDLSKNYKISDLEMPDATLSALLKEKITSTLPKGETCKDGICGSSDSFYGSQARSDKKFRDENENLINEILMKYPRCRTLDMESYNVIATALMAKKKDIYASAVSLIVTNRMHIESKMNKAQEVETEDLTGYGIFKALASFDFPEGEPMASLDMIKRVKFQSS